jgi:hypothetical protein
MGGGEAQKTDSSRNRRIADANGEPEAVEMAVDADAKWSASH